MTQSTMMQSSEPAHADLESLRVVIARSPIRVAAGSLYARLADWANTRHAADIDAVILDWLAGQAREARGIRRLDA